MKRVQSAPSFAVRLAAVVAGALLALGVLAPVPAAASSGDVTVIGSLVNHARAAHGLAPLRMVADLNAVAQAHTQDMASSGRLYHNPDLASQVSNWTRLAENVGYGGSLGSVHDALMASPGHRANILDSRVSEIGVGVVWAGSRVWVTQVFRAPVVPSAPVAPALAPAGTDVFAVMPGGTGSGRVEVHGLSRASGYSRFAINAATGLAASDPGQWSFFVAPYRGSGAPDLFCIKRSSTGSGRVEVHVLTAASGYRSFALHAATSLPANDPGAYQFAIGSLDGDRRSNLYAIKTARTASARTEVHVLGEVGDYRYWVLHAATALPTVDTSRWTFLVGDRWGMGDLIGVLRSGTGSGRTEVHALSRLSGYRSFGAQVATPLEESPSGFSFVLGDVERDGRPDLYAMKTQGGASGTTEVHVMAGASQFTTWSLNAASGLSTLPPAVSFGSR